MADVKRLPGVGCVHYMDRHCLYQEHLNPGYVSAWRCRVVSHWEVAFDDFLERAELFEVAQCDVPKLWRCAFDRLARDVLDCTDYRYTQKSELPPCEYVLNGLCVLRLPECVGRCRHYTIVESSL